jgi:hypothetical protein
MTVTIVDVAMVPVMIPMGRPNLHNNLRIRWRRHCGQHKKNTQA